MVHLYQSCIYKEVADEVQPSVSLMFFPDFNIFCDLSLYRPSQQNGLYLFEMIKMLSLVISSYFFPSFCEKLNYSHFLTGSY